MTEAKVRQVDAALRELPEVLYTYATVNTGNTLGKNYASVYVKLKPRKERTRSQHVLTQPGSGQKQHQGDNQQQPYRPHGRSRVR